MESYINNENKIILSSLVLQVIDHEVADLG